MYEILKNKEKIKTYFFASLICKVLSRSNTLQMENNLLLFGNNFFSEIKLKEIWLKMVFFFILSLFHIE
jgi:hypothetical protein